MAKPPAPPPPPPPPQSPPSPFNSPVDFRSPNFGAGPGLDDDFRGWLHKAGALALMLDPMYQQQGQALLGMEQNRAEQRYKGRQMNETSAWLQSKGMDPGQANYLVQNPDALKEYWQKTQPNYQTTQGYGPGGGQTTLAYNANDPNAPPIQIGGEAPENATWHDVYSPDGSRHRILQGDRTGKLLNADGGTSGLPDTDVTVVNNADGSQTKITRNKATSKEMFRENIAPRTEKPLIVPDGHGGRKMIMTDNEGRPIPNTPEWPVPTDMDPGRVAAISQLEGANKALDDAPGYGQIGRAFNSDDYSKTQAAAAAFKQAAAAAGVDVSDLLPVPGEGDDARKIKSDARKVLLKTLQGMVPGGGGGQNIVH